MIKESGDEGGTADKVRAALNLSIPVVVVGRPRPEDARDDGERERLSEGAPVMTARRREEVLNWAAGLPDTQELG